MSNGTTDKPVNVTKLRAGVKRYAAALALGGLMAGVLAGCGGGGGGSSSPSGPTAPGLPTTPTSGDFNDLVVRLDVVSGGYTATKLASEADSAPDTTFGTYLASDSSEKTVIWKDSVANGTTANVAASAAAPEGFYIDNASPTAIQKGEAGTWYTQTSLNSDGYQHVLVLQRGASTYYLCFEDAKLPHDDQHLKEPTLKNILAADGATFNGNTVEVSTETF